VAHLPFVHYNTIGRGNKTLVNGPYTTSENGAITVYPDNEVDVGQTPKKPEDFKTPPHDFFVQFKFPNIWQNHIGRDYRIVVSFTPIDEENTLMYLRTYQKVGVPGLGLLARFVAGRGSLLIADQDRRVVITQEPKKPVLGGGERLLSGDRPIALYRMERQKLIEEAEKRP
jgi:phenylpropionate dioxygenase-like ring-hydroxylating dioxygenase large terminal subunit